MNFSPITSRHDTRHHLEFRDEDDVMSNEAKLLRFAEDSDDELMAVPVESSPECDTNEPLLAPAGPRGAKWTPFRPVPSLSASTTRSPTQGLKTPNTGPSLLWDSGIGSPTPGSSPRKGLSATPLSVMRLSGGMVGDPRPMGYSPVPQLNYDSDDEMMEESASEVSWCASDTPPHRRLKTLRLHDKPKSPRTLLRETQTRGRGVRPDTKATRKRVAFLNPDKAQTNVNPFSDGSEDLEKSGVKRARCELNGEIRRGLALTSLATRTTFFLSDDELSVEDIGQASHKRLALRELSISRFVEEFHTVGVIGDGEFGSVYDCINRLDGCHYAIKKSKLPVAESFYERSALKEVYAHAVLGKHQHVVRYHSAWAEDGHMFIQNEFCNGGSLAAQIDLYRRTGERFTESELKQILVHVARGLDYIHSAGLVHLDIKPGNIFLQRETNAALIRESGSINNNKQEIIYKIGDLGHVTLINSPVVEEGDCRYLPVEVLQERNDHLTQADVFSLALTVYELATLEELPKNGDGWRLLREEGLPPVNHLSHELNSLLKLMASYDSTVRPTAAQLLQHPILAQQLSADSQLNTQQLSAESQLNTQQPVSHDQQLLQQQAQQLSAESQLNTQRPHDSQQPMSHDQQLLQQAQQLKSHDTQLLQQSEQLKPNDLHEGVERVVDESLELLYQQLRVERLKNELLTRELVAVKDLAVQQDVPMTNIVRTSAYDRTTGHDRTAGHNRTSHDRTHRLLGRKCVRSASWTMF